MRFRPLTSTRRVPSGFTLIELLVVIAIIAILAAILFPVFAQARAKARQASSISNLRQLGMAVAMYAQDYERYPFHSSPSAQVPRTRWPDYLWPYVKNGTMFRAPGASEDHFLKAFAHDARQFYGGYGYNYQYLGNNRHPFTATDAEIERPAETIALADTSGCSYDLGVRNAGNYVVDPPLPSLRGSRPNTPGDGFYGAPGTSECTGAAGCRAVPAERHSEMVTVAFCDGHAKPMKRRQMDDHNRDNTPDNGFWNGYADPARR
jgi:prepilin-type N-terminal cleavage/methylation domain-containing protein/prepilin-type processing-associated H-X9-DG protein